MEVQNSALPRPPFSASAREKIGAFAAYFAAYLYACAFLFHTSDSAEHRMLMALFVAVFVLGTLAFVQPAAIPRESWFWLGCLLVAAAGCVVGKNRVWGGWNDLLLHGFAIYWVLSVTDRLMEERSGRYLALDLFNGVFAFPICHFPLRLRCVWAALRGGKEKRNVLPAVLAVLVSLAILLAAIALLAQADDTFAGMADTLFGLLGSFRPTDVLWRILVSLPVGAWLFALVAGSCRTEQEKLHARCGRIQTGLETMRKVPAGVWNVILAVFSLLYLAFFVVQGSYLFGAFTRTLPEGFTVAAYARRGFFELCGVAVLNNLLLWLALRSTRRTSAGKILCTVLTVCTLLLSVTALSKLLLYINCFGFTPRRLQSTWLALVLLSGAVSSLLTLWTAKKPLRWWILFSGATLALLMLY